MPKDAEPSAVSAEASAWRTRMRRFELQVPLRYRVSGEIKWLAGETENISSSGVFFRSQRLAEPSASIELCLMMPAINSAGAAEVVCRGRVVRVVAPAEVGTHCLLAVEILHFRLVRT